MLTRLRRRLALGTVPTLLFLSAVLTSMAYASPPDPSWINGFYDGDDLDDVVDQVTSGSGAIELTPFAELVALPPFTAWVIQGADSFAPIQSSSQRGPRAPPAL